MSRVMYSYRLPKERWWEFAQSCREAYAASHPLSVIILRVAHSARDLPPDEKASKMVSILDIISKLGEWTIDLQLFDEGDTYIIRPLERGYFFLNNHTQWVTEFGLEPVFYDDRSDVPAEQEGNREVSLWCDAKIARGEYLLYQVITEDSLSQAVFDALMGQEEGSACPPGM